jgi:regulator of sirC expression with transglutaminase-like and TPR domain
MSTAEINALITLLEDPDEGIFNHIEQAIVAKGEIIIPQLERYSELNNYGDLFQQRLEHLIRSIQTNSVQDRLIEWKKLPDNDLLEGALLVHQFQYPSCDIDEIRHQIRKIRQDIWLELNDSLTAFEQVNVINHILYTVYGFEGNKKDFVSPQNSFIGDVLSQKKGNPLSLAILYQVLANSLEIPIYGVNLPNHFILCYMDENHCGMDNDDPDEQGVLFYINPFAEGSITLINEIDAFLFHLNLPQEVKYYRPCNNTEIINRMMTNLIFAFTQQDNLSKVEALKQLQEAFTSAGSE